MYQGAADPVREKPTAMAKIPGTSWRAVLTSRDNVFYFHYETKQKSWYVPSLLVDAMDSIQAAKTELVEEAQLRRRSARRTRRSEEARVAREGGTERLAPASCQNGHLKSTADAGLSNEPDGSREAEVGRKFPRSTHLDPAQRVLVKPVDHEDSKDEVIEMTAEDVECQFQMMEEEREGKPVTPQQAGDEMMQRAASPGMAPQPQPEAPSRESDSTNPKTREKTEFSVEHQSYLVSPLTRYVVPAGVCTPPLSQNHTAPPLMTLSEKFESFKELLADVRASPCEPWEKLMKRISTDSRSGLLTSKQKATAFRAYCKTVLASAAKSELGGTSQDHGTSQTSADGFRYLLAKYILKPNQLTWEGFRRRYKKEQKYLAFQGDPVRKHKPAKTIEREMIALFNEHVGNLRKSLGAKEVWSELKKLKGRRNDDPDELSQRLRRSTNPGIQEAVKSERDPTRMVRAFLAGKTAEEFLSQARNPDEKLSHEEIKKQRKEQSLRERQRQYDVEQAKRRHHEREGKKHALKDDASRQLQSLLVDYVREPPSMDEVVDHRQVIDVLSRDERWSAVSRALMTPQELEEIVHKHVDSLRDRRKHQIATLLKELVGDEWTVLTFKNIKPLIRAAPDKFSRFSIEELDLQYSICCEEWLEQARRDLDDLLRESKFTQYWIKVGPSVSAGHEIDLNEVHEVLKEDKRYTIFDDMSEERDEKIKEYVNKLTQEREIEQEMGYGSVHTSKGK